MECRLNQTEIACVEKLAELLEKGECYVRADFIDDDDDEPAPQPNPLNVPPEKRAATLELMESMGVIAEVEHASGLRFFSFRITSKALQVVRAIKEEREKEKEPEDVVEQLKSTAKSKPILAWIIIGFVVLTAVVTFANQTIQLLEKIGVVAASPQK